MGGPVVEGAVLIDAARLVARARARGVPVPVVMDEVASTQDVARAWAEEGKPAGVSVLALRQTGGRGRLGRSWVATDGALALSVVLRPSVPTTRLGLLPLAAAVGVREACSPLLRIKWPNDLLTAQGRKVAGLLAEAEISGGRVRHVVLGVGVNVSASPGDLPAASLADLGCAHDLGKLAVDVVASLLTWTARAFDAPDRVVAAWSEASATLGARVRVGALEGVAEDVAPDGSLRLRMDDGTLQRVVAGDVEAVREVRGMIAAIPFYELRMVPDGVRVILGTWQAVVPTYGIPIDPWATLVCLGVLLGMEVSRARAIRMGLEVRDIVDGIVFTVLCGFFIAHVFTVVAYYPERLKTDGIWAILRVWQGFSSTGGFIGGLAGLFLYYKVVGYWYLKWTEPRDVMRFADLIAFGFPVGWLFGRMGCAVVHDHIGMVTTSPIGVYFPEGSVASGVRYELGLYEMVLTLPMLLLFFWLGKKDRAPGTFLGLFFILYAPVRFGLDFLRNTDLENHDVRYFGMTPAQYGMFVLLAVGVWLVVRRRGDFHPWPLDGLPDQEGRAQGVPGAASTVPADGV